MNLPKMFKKYEHMISFISDERKDGDGCWVNLKSTYISPDTECGTIHENTFRECIKYLKRVVSIN